MTSTALAYLRLFRLPNVFTAVADVTTGFLAVRGAVDGGGVAAWLCLAAASALLYTAGMVLNDVFDYREDLQQRPQRPLPAGQIAWPAAAALGAALLAGGVLLGAAAPALADPPSARPAAAALVAVLLAGCVLAYDAVMKKTPLGPLTMGACRGLNMLLGMTLVTAGPSAGPLWGLTPAHVVIAAGLAVYVTGLTWFARREAEQSGSRQLALALLVLLAGIALLATFPQWAEPGELPARPMSMWWLLMAALAAAIARPFVQAVSDPSPQRVQAAVKHGILSIVMLDAAVALRVAQHPLWAVLVVALLLPTLLLGRVVYST